MSVTYSDIVNAMVEAEERGLDVDCAVLTTKSMDTFLVDDKFTDEEEQRQRDVIGEDWTLEVKSGYNNFLRLEDGSKIRLD